MKTGTVKWFDAEKGYGFLRSDNGDEELFVHFSQIASKGYKELEAGQRVQFDAVNTAKGLQAQNVAKLD